MPEADHFPEVSNWYREDPAIESELTDIWFNDVLGLKMTVRSVDGPFRHITSKYVVEVREYPSDDPEWEQIGDAMNKQSAAQQLAYEYATEHNEPDND